VTSTPQSTSGRSVPSYREALVAAALAGIMAAAVFVTYARLDPENLYHTSVGGLPGAFGRTLVLLNYPLALVAIAFAAMAASRLGRRRADAVAVASAILCAVVALPGVLDQDDLDARWVNAVPALGVALAGALTVAALLAGGVGQSVERAYGDRLRVAIAAALLVLAIPWYFAELGFYAPDPILADEVRRVQEEGERLAAVHLGHHHGTGGVLLALTALGLSRTLATHRRRRLESLLSGYLALMLAYGVALVVEDAWGEQVWKRGWTDHDIPGLVRPDLAWTWAAIVAAAVAVELLWFRRARRR
jgi:hypothetical protein